MTGFDYAAPADVYANRQRGAKRPMFYQKFPSVAEALRFIVEELPGGMINVLLETDDERFDGPRLRALYDAEDYPLPRSAR